MLTSTHYTEFHNNVAKILHQEICNLYEIVNDR